MIKVGIIGMGMMGRTHYEQYQKLPNVTVVAICDADPVRAAGNLAGTAGNVLAGGITQIAMTDLQAFSDYRQLIGLRDLDLVDICAPTPTHVEIAVAALKKGRHVLCEKPLARTVSAARRVVRAAAGSSGYLMPAMVMRFWPQWAWLKGAVADRRYGAVKGAIFRRLATMPRGWYADGTISGGALMDVHIHDTDFVQYLFGRPAAVYCRGYAKTSGQLDHLVTHYVFEGPEAPPLVVAEGGWCLADGFGFQMRYTVNFETATADFDLARATPLLVFREGRQEVIDCGPEDGYIGELRYFTECIAAHSPPTVVTAAAALQAMEILHAEQKSATTGKPVRLR